MKAAALWLMFSLVLAAQQPRDGSISGTVVTDDASATPVRRATITLTADTATTRVNATTDDSGRFSFVGLPAGRYSLTAAKGAYLSAAYGSKRPGGPGIPPDNQSGNPEPGCCLVLQDGQKPVFRGRCAPLFQPSG